MHVWLQAGAARAEPYLRAHGCEAWQLRRAGHRPEAGLPLGAGLGLLMQDQPQDGEPVWLAELAHLALGADQAMLADPDQMDLRAEESAALYDTVRPLFDGTGFAAEPLDARRWRLRLPEGLRPATASPLAVRRPPAERLVEAGRRNPSVAPAAQ